MNRFSHQEDEDQDSLFGSPPPSPARGRSPSQETSIRGEELSPVVAIPGKGASVNVPPKNVGTIALPGSHMSCAELPANLPASSSSLPGSSQDSLSIPRPNVAGTPVALQPGAGSVPSRSSSASSSAPSASTSTRKRKAPKARSTASAPPPPPITLPGPNEPTPPNFLRSQSALLGHAGLVGSVKPAKLYTHDRPSAQPSRSETPIRGSTPTHPIVLDDDQDNSQVRKRPSSQIQLPHHLDQLNPDVLRENALNSLAKEKNTLPVLESLIKLLGGEPSQPSPSFPSLQPFARPYGHGIFDTPAGPTSTPPVAPPVKRRKLKHVPAGAADWDVPFPFAPGEGPEAYRDTWARDRSKQLVTQLLELVQSATKRAAVKTAKSSLQNGRGKTPQARISALKHQSSRATSVETQGEQSGQMETASTESAKSTSSAAESTISDGMTAMMVDSLDDFLRSLQIPDTGLTSTPGPSDGISVSSSGMAEGVTPGPEPSDCSAFEVWLSQLQQFVSDASTPDSDWSTRQSLVLDDCTSSRSSSIPAPIRDASQAPHTIQDEAIDPTLLAMSYPTPSTTQTHSVIPSPSTLASASIDTQMSMSDIASPPPALAHSPRTSLSSFTEPLTPLSDAFTEVPTTTSMMMAHEEHVRDPWLTVSQTHQSVEKDDRQVALALPLALTEHSQDEVPRLSAVQKGKTRADASVSSAASVSSRSTPGTVSTTKGKLDKQAIVARAMERRRQLVAEIERSKIELWETSIEAGVLVHLIRDEALTRDDV